MTTTDLEYIDAAPATSMVVAGSTPQEILANAATIATHLKDLIEQQNLYVTVGRDRKTGVERRHVEVSGWQAAGAMLGALGGTALHAYPMWTRRVDRDDGIVAYESRCEIRTINGDVVGAGESLCSSAESNWRGRDEFAIKGMAETRAESRAWRKAIGWIISLAGFSATPAEETGGTVESGGPAAAPPPHPGWAAPVSDISGVAESLVRLLEAAGVEKDASRLAVTIGEKTFERCNESVPLAVWMAFNDIADALQAPAEPAPVDAETTSDPDIETDMNQDTNNEGTTA